MRKQKSFVFEQRLIILVLVAIATHLKTNESLLLASNSLQNFKQIEQKTPEILHFHSLMSCRIASVTSYLRENEAKDLQNGDLHLAQIPDFGMEYLENYLSHWGQ